MSWSKKRALKELQRLIDWTTDLESEPRFGEGHMRWLATVRTFLADVFGEDSFYFQSIVKMSWDYVGYVQRNPLAVAAAHQETYVERLGSSRGLLLAAGDELRRTDLSSVYHGRNTGPEASLILKVINLAEHKLRKTLRVKPTRERQIQLAFENLLIAADIPFSREIGGIEYSSKTYQPDFVVNKADLVVELKLCKKSGREKDIIAEINDDILAYQTKHANIVFVVYDLGQIRDIERFSSSFQTEKVIVRVVKH